MGDSAKQATMNLLDKPGRTASDGNCSDTSLMKALEFTTILKQPARPGLEDLVKQAGRPVESQAAQHKSGKTLPEVKKVRGPEETGTPRVDFTQSDFAQALGIDSADTGELRERLSALQKQLHLRDAALDSTTSHFMITVLDVDGPRIVYVNRSLCREFGYSPEELIGQSPVMLSPPELNPDADRVLREARANGRGIRVRLRSRRKDGSTFISGITMTPLRIAGTKIYSVSVGANISSALVEREAKARLQDQLVEELRERERMSMELHIARKLESVGRLASGIAHEINTPIHFVGDGVSFLKSAVADLRQLLEIYRDAVENLVRGAEPEPVQRRLKDIEEKFDRPFLDEEIPAAFERTHEGIERVASIVRAMKEFAHPDEHEHSPADINRAIETTLLVASNEYKYCAKVQTELTELPPVMCNIGEINQVFLNLIINAAHAIQAAGRDADSGLIRIHTASSGNFVEIVFEDNGCGIPKENLERMFDPFFTTKEVGKGTGQGLAISRSIIVEKHSGKIDVDSEVGRGTRMILRLPVGG